MSVQFFKDVSDAKASQGKKEDGTTLPDGAIVFTKEKHIFMKQDGVTKRYGGDDEPTSTVNSTDVILGGLPKGTDLTGKTALEIVESILNVEYAPKWTAATFGAISPDVTVLAVGSAVPAQTAFSISGGSAASAAGKTTVTGGAKTDTITATTAFGTTITSRSTVTINGSRTYAAGSGVVNSSKGNSTNKTATNTTTLLVSASANTDIDSSSKKIKAKTGSATAGTVYFAWPVYIDNTQQELSYDGTEYQANLGALTGSNSHTFSVPSTYTNVKLYTINPTDSTKWIEQSFSGTAATESKKVANQDYKKYTFNNGGGTLGATLYKLTFTIA